MAQVPPSPWSRWDTPNYQYFSNKTRLPFPLQNDAEFENSGSQFGNRLEQKLLKAGKLLGQKANPNDANFINCIYGIENSTVRVIEQCLASVGCCETSCCSKNHLWHEKYIWAIVLLAIFCFIVLFSLLLILFCWLYNRSKDKRQKQVISQSMSGLSPAISQEIENRNESGYYPYVGGPNQF